MKKTLTVVDTNGNLQNLALTLKDLWEIQTKESKRTFALGMGATSFSIASMLMPKGTAKRVTLGLGLIGTIATSISNYDCVKKCDSNENIVHVHQIISEIAKRNGITIDL